MLLRLRSNPGCWGQERPTRIAQGSPGCEPSPDALGQHLLRMFLMHSSVMQNFGHPSESLNDVANRLSAMNDSTKRHLLARVERLLGVPSL